jgi:hypothetical protein
VLKLKVSTAKLSERKDLMTTMWILASASDWADTHVAGSGSSGTRLAGQVSSFDENPAGSCSRPEKGISEQVKKHPWHEQQSPIPTFPSSAQSSTEVKAAAEHETWKKVGGGVQAVCGFKGR